MKRILTILTLTLFTLGIVAVPAKKGIWQTMSLNGTLVKAQLMGDEHMHYWLTDDGRQLTEVDGTFTEADMPRLTSHAQQRRTKAAASRQRRVQHRAVGDFSHYSGQKKGLIILVEYNDLSLQADHDSVLYSRICNETGYNEGQFQGSVHDYFLSQSYGEFDLTFDVVGPVTVSNDYSYYGKNSGGEDQYPATMVIEACKLANSQVNFADYDWDDDGEVEEVFLLYAGHGENDYYHRDSTVIWPHMACLSIDWPGYERSLTLQGKRIDIYACSNEINASGELSGLGTFCHEFSHCLGLPDLYDTKTGRSVLGRYDLMDAGCYSGDSWCPVGYSSYERYACGWLTPMETDNPAAVESLHPLHQEPDVRIYRPSDDASDCYLIENRQKESWDTYFPKAGLLCWHIDYDALAWAENTVNNDPEHLRVEHMKVSNIPVGIAPTSLSSPLPSGIYNLYGQPIVQPSRSDVYILRYADGSTKKIKLRE